MRPTAELRARLPLGLLLVAAVALPGSAQGQQCRDRETLDDCWNRHYDEDLDARGGAAADTAALQAALRLYGKATGLGGGSGAALASAIEDFLPTLAGIVALDREHADDDVVLGFDLNLPLDQRPGGLRRLPDLGGTVRASARFREARLFRPLADAVPAARREAVREALERGLDDFDDLTVGLAFNREGRGIGRSFHAHARLVDDLLAGIVSSVRVPRPSASQLVAEWRDGIVADVGRAGTGEIEGCDAATGPVEMRCLTPAFRGRLEAAIVADAEGRRAYRTAVDSAVAASGFHRVADLVNNQPQLSLSGGARLRADVVGPDEYSLRVRYENGLANVNGLRGLCGDAVDPACFRRYLNDDDVRARLRRSDRFWASAELRLIEAFRFDRTVLGEALTLATGRSVSARGEAGYGRYLRVDAEGQEQARIDVLLEAELHDADSGRRDRWGLGITYTHRISDTFAVPVSLTWASGDELLVDVDGRLSVNVGARYRLRREPPG